MLLWFPTTSCVTFQRSNFKIRDKGKMAEAPQQISEENDVTEDVTEQAAENATDPADLQQTAEVVSQQVDDHLSSTRAVSSAASSKKKKKKKDKAGDKTSENEKKSSAPMSNVKNLQELINKLSNMPNLTADLSETDGASKGHEFWDTQPVPKLGNVLL